LPQRPVRARSLSTFDPATKKLTVVETALEMIAKGEAPKMPRRCR
jgi:hypothetical protein